MDAITPKAKPKGQPSAAPRRGKPTRQRVELAKLRMHYEGVTTQLRLKQDDAVVLRYADEMRRGDRFPAIDAVSVGDGTYFIGDGWHRVEAAKLNVKRDGRRKAAIEAVVHVAPEDMTPINYAIRLALRANTTHGLMLTRGDQIHRAKVALKLPEFQGLSNSELEQAIGASRMTIGRARAEMLASGELPELHTGEPLPPFVPEEYASAHRKGTRGHPLRWDLELREAVFGFVELLTAAFAPRDWSYSFDGEDKLREDGDDDDEGEDDDPSDHWNGSVMHYGLVPDRVVMFDPFQNTVTKEGMPKQRTIVDPHAVITDEQRMRIERAKREREMKAAWGRIDGHVDKDVPRAVRRIVEHAEREPGFLDDLHRVLPIERSKDF